MGTKGGPPARKAPGTAVGVQNGQRAVLTQPGERFDPPEHIDQPEALQAWDDYWADPVSSVVTQTDHTLLIRWIDATNRYWTLIREADEQPIVYSGANGTLAHPLYKVAVGLMNQINNMEAQLGVGPRSRNRLGIQIVGLETARQNLSRGKTKPPKPPKTRAYDDEDPRYA